MELLGYFIVYSLCVCLRRPIAVDLVESIAGGAAEEMMESVVQATLSKLTSFHKDHKEKKLSKEFAEQLREYINGLPPTKKDEFNNFLNRLNLSSMPTEQSKKFKQLLESMVGSNIDGRDDADIVEAIKRYNRDFWQAIKQMHAGIDQLQDKNWNIDIETISLHLFGTEWREIPPSVQNFLKLIEKQVYKSKYLKMSSEDRDMVNVMSNMIDEKNSELIAELKPYFNHMAQIREYTGISDSEIELAKIAKADPFCYFLLECPECHATGKDVHRDNNDIIHCRCCGKEFGIIRAIKDEEIVKEFERVKKEIHGFVQINVDHNTEIKNKIDELAGKIVGVEYFDAFKQSIQAQNENAVSAVSDLLKTSEAKILSRLEALKNELPKSDENQIVTSISEQISKLDKENQKHLQEIRNALLQACEGISDLKAMCKTIIEQTDDQNVLKEIHQAVCNLSQVITRQNTCPCCGLQSNFKRIASEEDYVCPYCNLSVHKNEMANITRVQLKNTVNMEIKMVEGSLTINKKGDNGGEASQVNAIRLFLTSEPADALNNSSGMIKNLHKQYKPETLILRGDINLMTRAVKRLIWEYGTLKNIVFGDGVDVEDPLLIHQWKYNHSIKRLSKIE